MWSIKNYSYILTSTSCVGVVTNLLALMYITKEFDTSKNIFYVLLLDILSTLGGNSLYFTCNIIDIFKDNLLSQNKIGCNVFAYGVALPGMIGVVTALMVSFRRFLLLKYPMVLSETSQTFNFSAFVIIGAIFGFLGAHLHLTPNEFTVQCLGDTNGTLSTLDSTLALVSYFVSLLVTLLNFEITFEDKKLEKV